MAAKRLQFGDEARNSMIIGVDKLANAVRETMGPRGRNVVIERDFGAPYITKDGVTVAKEIDLSDSFENLGAQMIKDVAAKTGDESGDGPQPLYSKVLTPTGFTTMGQLKVGDRICGTNSTVQTVVGVFPKGEKEIVKVHFSGGRVVECCEDHVWGITTYYGLQRVLTAKTMLESGSYRISPAGDRVNLYYTPRTAVEFDAAQVPLHPYLMGVLLGDGSLSGKGEIEISLGLKKEHIIPKLVLPEGFSLDVSLVEEKNYLRIKIKGRSVDGRRFHDLLEGLGLLGSLSDTKHIPEAYLINDQLTRMALLQGLLDTDGYMNTRGRFEFSTVSPRLKEDFVNLCYSLGIPLHIKIHDRSQDGGSYSNRPIYRITQLKGDMYGDKILNIERTGVKTEMQCIKVSNSDSLYITDGFVVTHNTTTSTVLAQAIVHQGIKFLMAGSSPVEIKRGIDKVVADICAELRAMAKPVSSSEEVAQVGAISANNEREIGDLIAEAMDKVGMDGVISVEESSTPNTYLSLEEGLQLNSGYVSNFFMPPNETSVTYENCLIALIDQDIHNIQDLLGMIKQIIPSNMPLLIVCNNLAGQALHTIITNHTQGVFKCVAVQSPSFGENREKVLDDLAVLTGGKVLGNKAGRVNPRVANTDANFWKSHCGMAKSVTVSKSTTIIKEGQGNTEQIKERIDSLSEILKNTESEFDKEKIQQRIGNLSGGIAVINVGGYSEVEIKEKRDRVDDALHATRAAVAGGIVPGGGTALLWAAQRVRESMDVDSVSKDQQIGKEIILKAVEAPARQIVINAGGRPDVVVERIQKDHVGYNAHTDEYGDLIEQGVIDPVNVTISAITNAASVAGMLLTTSCAITKEKSENPFEGLSVPNL